MSGLVSLVWARNLDATTRECDLQFCTACGARRASVRQWRVRRKGTRRACNWLGGLAGSMGAISGRAAMASSVVTFPAQRGEQALLLQARALACRFVGQAPGAISEAGSSINAIWHVAFRLAGTSHPGLGYASGTMSR